MFDVIRIAPDQVHVLVYVGLLLLASQAGGRVANLLNAPRVTGYLVIGILLGPSVFGLLSRDLIVHDMSLMTDVALSVIAFSVGGSLALPKLKRLGGSIFGVGISQALGASIAVTAAMWAVLPIASPESSVWPTCFALALVIGAVSAATAPAAIISIVREYRARGPFTTMLLGVVAIDDALTIVLFAIATHVAGSLTTNNAVPLYEILLTPLVHVLLALALGAVMGWIVRATSRMFPGRVSLLANILGAVLLTAGLALSLECSPLLACMMLGFVVVNFVERQEDAFAAVDQIEEPLFGMFFALAGAHIEIELLRTAGWLALVIVASRFAGKLLGSRLAAQVFGAGKTVRDYLGFGLLPKAGVTVGLILQAKGHIVDGQLTQIAFNAVLASVLLNELISPFLVRFALFRAGEVHTTMSRSSGDRP